jgi:threonyl-tRNA synthetase
MHNGPLSEIFRGAAELLAAAVLELFPGTLLVQGGESSLGFYYDFVLTSPFDQTFLPLLEERLRSVVKERRAIRTLEMVPHNAAEYLDHRAQYIQGECVRNSKEPLITLFEMGTFLGFYERPVTFKDSGFLSAFKLKGFETLRGDRPVTRLFGTAYGDQKGLKGFLKKIASFKDHVELGRELNLLTLSQGSLFWHPRGEELRYSLLLLWREWHRKQNFKFLSTHAGSALEVSRLHLQMHRSEGYQRLAECFYECGPKEVDCLKGLFGSRPLLREQAHLFCNENIWFEEILSSLQFMLKIPRIFAFEYEVVLSSASQGGGRELLVQALDQCQVPFVVDGKKSASKSPRLDLHMKDALGRTWPLSSLIVHLKERVLVRSLFGSFEHLIAFLIEHYQGEFPFWLAPEQVRIIAIGEKGREESLAVYHELCAQGFRVSLDSREKKADQRMHEALREKIPYVIFVGEKEKKSQLLRMRVYGRQKEERVKREDLIQQLHVMNRNIEFEN